MKKIIALLSLALAVLLVFTGCGATHEIKIESSKSISIKESIKLTEQEYNDLFQRANSTGTLPIDTSMYKKVTEGENTYYVVEEDNTYTASELCMDDNDSLLSMLYQVKIITDKEFLLSESTVSVAASYLKDATSKITVTFPEKIKFTNGTLSNDDKTVTFDGLKRGSNIFAATETSNAPWAAVETVEESEKIANEVVNSYIDPWMGTYPEARLSNNTTAVIEWEKVDKATSYDVYMKVGKGKAKKIGTTNKDYFVAKNLTLGQKNSFDVIARNQYWKTELVDYAAYVTPLNTKSTAAISSVKASKSKKATVSVKKTDYADGYIVYMSKKNKKSSFSKVGTIKGNKTLKYTTKKLSKGTYYFKVKAYKKVNGKTYYNKTSGMKGVKIK